MAKNKEFLTEDELELVYEVLSEYADNMDELLGDEYSEDLFNLYIKLGKKFGNLSDEDEEDED